MAVDGPDRDVDRRCHLDRFVVNTSPRKATEMRRRHYFVDTMVIVLPVGIVGAILAVAGYRLLFCIAAMGYLAVGLTLARVWIRG